MIRRVRRASRSAPLVPILLLFASGCSGQATQPVSPSNPPSFGGTAAAAPAGWPTYHRDLSRSADDPSSPSLRSAQRVWVSASLDGQVFAEPLVIGTWVFVATEHDSMYALDARSGRTLWRTHLGEPVPRSGLPCGDIDPLGITGTPVADAQAGRLWLVAFVQPGRHELVSLDLADGSVRSRRSIDPPGADPRALQQRAALALSLGVVYAAFGGLFGDCEPTTVGSSARAPMAVVRCSPTGSIATPAPASGEHPAPPSMPPAISTSRPATGIRPGRSTSATP